MDKSRSIEELRKELDKVDDVLMRTFAERLRVVTEINQVKKSVGISLFDRSREREVFDKSAERAATYGIDPNLAKQLVATLIDTSHQLQEEAQVDSAKRSERFLIVGGRGKMGTLFSKAFSKLGFTVDLVEKGDAITAATFQAADIVIISVPMDVASQVTAKVAPLLRKDALLCDFNSLKLDVCKAMQQHGTSETLGLHPMFGPSVASFRRQKIVACPINSGPRAKWFTTELGRMGFEIVESDAETHDRMMSIIQVLTHLGTMVMGEALRLSGVSLEQTLSFTSPIYRLELAMVGRLFVQDPNLYAEIALSNPHAEESRKIFREAAATMTGILTAGDRNAFRQQFLEIQNHFKGFASDAMKLSDRIIESITREP